MLNFLFFNFDIGELKTMHRRASKLYTEIKDRLDDTCDPVSHHILALCHAALDRGNTNIIILQNQSKLMRRQEEDELRSRLGRLFPAITEVLKLADPTGQN